MNKVNKLKRKLHELEKKLVYYKTINSPYAKKILREIHYVEEEIERLYLTNESKLSNCQNSNTYRESVQNWPEKVKQFEDDYWRNRLRKLK